MKTITNKSRRRLGIPGRQASFILAPGQSKAIGDDDLAFIRKNRTAGQWLERGVLAVTEDVAVKEVAKPTLAEPQPEPVSNEGFQLRHSSHGWFDVYVNGFQVNTRKMRKDEAEALRQEYE